MAPYKSISTLAHDAKLANSLGNMVVAWANAERVLLGTMARVLSTNLNFLQPAYYRLPTFEARVKFIRCLVGEWNPPARYSKTKIDKCLETLGRLASTRNHWVHGDWCASSDLTETVIFDHRSPASSSNRRKPVKAADVQNHIAAVLTRCQQLEALIGWSSIPA